MSATTDAWTELYAAQTEALSVAIVATVTGFAIDKPAILTAVNLDEQIISGGIGEAGGYELQMLETDLSAEPPKFTPVSCNGSATGQALIVLSTKLNNGIWYLTVGDPSVQG